MHESKNKEVEAKVDPFNTIPSDPLGNFVCPIFAALESIGLEVQVPKGSTLLLGDLTTVTFNCNL